MNGPNLSMEVVYLKNENLKVILPYPLNKMFEINVLHLLFCFLFSFFIIIIISQFYTTFGIMVRCNKGMLYSIGNV